MPVTSPYSLTYGGFSVGAATARRIMGKPKWHLIEDSFGVASIEFTFVTKAASDAAFATEVAAVEAAFRKPRQDLTLTQNGSTLVSWKQSDNTGFDSNPSITKRGAAADTGLSREYTVRIEFGRPADNISTTGRRWSQISTDFDASRRRTVTISGTWTAIPTPVTAAEANYYANIYTYAGTVLTAIDSSASFEPVQENVNRGETDKTVEFSLTYREIIHDQSLSLTNDLAIVDPVMTIESRRIAPGDSLTGDVAVGGASTVERSSGSVNTVTQGAPGGNVGGGVQVVARPIMTTINYRCSIDKVVTKDLKAKYNSTIRPLIIRRANYMLAGAVILVEERMIPEPYSNSISAVLTFLSYTTNIFEQKIHVEDFTNYGKVLIPVTTSDPFDYYELQGPVERIRTYSVERKMITTQTDPAAIIDALVAQVGSQPKTGKDDENWTLKTRKPGAVVLRQGLSGGVKVNIAEVSIETTLQYRKRKTPSVANAGGLPGTVQST